MDAELARGWLDFGQLAAGVLIFTAGAIQLAFWHPFDKHRRTAIGLLGLAGVLYGVRLLGGRPDVQALVPASPIFWLALNTSITYVLLVPVVWFFEVTLASGWRQSIRALRIAVIVYAVSALTIDAVTRIPGAAMGPNDPLVIIAVVLLVANSFTQTATGFMNGRIVQVGLLSFAAFVLFQNIINVRFFRGAWNVEWAGVLILMACLGYVAVTHAAANDRRLRDLGHELETARQIQVSILPRGMPAVERISLGARCLPMAAVGGDFYDFVEMGPGRLGLLVADVSGHGVPAALIASMVKVALVAQMPHADDPARVLAGLNQIFCGRLEHQFVTAAYAFVDAIEGRLRYGAAGHPPALLVRGRSDADAGEDAVEALTENGVLLGHFPDWTYTATERPFQSGDRLILYTDGVTEATDPSGVFFDGAGLRAFAHAERARPAEAFVGALVGHLSAFAGRPDAQGFDDDVTIVVADCLPVVTTR